MLFRSVSQSRYKAIVRGEKAKRGTRQLQKIQKNDNSGMKGFCSSRLKRKRIIIQKSEKYKRRTIKSRRGYRSKNETTPLKKGQKTVKPRYKSGIAVCETYWQHVILIMLIR